MIRLREIELKSFKNTRMGKMKLTDLQSGASILGLYGQNGSGKTSVVEAMSCLCSLLNGEPLAEDALDYISAGEDSFQISVVIQIDAGDLFFGSDLPAIDNALSSSMVRRGCTARYSAAVGARPDGTGPVVLDEALSLSAEGFSRRNLVRMRVSYPEGSGDDSASGDDAFILKQVALFGEDADNPSFSCEPVGKWRALFNFRMETAAQVLAAEQVAYDEGTSFVFSAPFARALVNLASGLEPDSLSSAFKATKEAFLNVVLPLLLVLPVLADYAANDIHLSTTFRSGMLPFHRIRIDELSGAKGKTGRRYLVLSTDEPFMIKPDELEELIQTIQALNVSLSALVPGLSLLVKRTDSIVGDDGRDAVRAELLSDRNGVRIPFRCESEGIQKLVSVLSMLVSAYNEPNACVVIDEFDSGVFELLLGEILRALAEGGKGQLIFTAHNLRALEVLPDDAVMITTVNPDNRFIRFRGVRPSNNMRDMYLRSLYLGGQKEIVYDPTDTLRIKSAFYDAGHSNEGPGDFAFLVESLGGSYGE